MKSRNIVAILILSLLAHACGPVQDRAVGNDDNRFSFAFLTDIHLKADVVDAFQMVIDTVNKMDVDFVMTGGDMVFDVMRGNQSNADSLFTLFKNESTKFDVPVYKCVGNHELFGIYQESPEDSLHPDYKYGMFERYFGKTYYSFDHKGWHFIVLNSLDTRNQRYVGSISPEQLEWLKKDLESISKQTPVAITLHIPMVSAIRQIFPKPNQTSGYGGLINQQQLMEIIEPYNLKLVLQGHLHWLEDINILNERRYITGGAVAGRPSWKGTRYGEEGFLKINIDGEAVSWDFIDYGWDNPF